MLFYTGCKLEPRDYFYAGQLSQWRSILESGETVFLNSPCGYKSPRIMRPLLFFTCSLKWDLKSTSREKKKKTEMCLKSISVNFPLSFFTWITGYATPQRQSSVVALGEHERRLQLMERKVHMDMLSSKGKAMGLGQDIWLNALRTRHCHPPEWPFILSLLSLSFVNRWLYVRVMGKKWCDVYMFWGSVLSSTVEEFLNTWRRQARERLHLRKSTLWENLCQGHFTVMLTEWVSCWNDMSTPTFNYYS